MSKSEKYAIRAIDLHKVFGDVHANKGISLDIVAGTIHGIVGENGAGKSTLMNMLYGFYQPTKGHIEIQGEPVALHNPQVALAHGVGMVHQHFKLVETFTVLENIMLGFEGHAVLSHAERKVRERLLEIEKSYGLNVSPDSVVGDLPVGLQQRVEILKALYRGANILILDEPTAVLTPQETQQLFTIMETLRNEGKTVLFITHKLHEIMAVTDNVTVIRHGKVVASCKKSETNESKLAELMVGKIVSRAVSRKKEKDRKLILRLKGVTAKDDKERVALENVSLDVTAGQVLGIAGVAGNGQSELLKAVTGMIAIKEGAIFYNDHLISSPKGHENPQKLRAMGIGHVAEDRLADGVVGTMSAWENSILGYQDCSEFQKNGVLRLDKIVKNCARLMEEHDVRPRAAELAIARFSGGNQQKLVIAREVDHNPQLLVIGQPTRGVDIGAVTRIHDYITALRNDGKAILVVSADLDELMEISDKIAVMCEGKIVGIVAVEDADERKLGLMMAGKKCDELPIDEGCTAKMSAVNG